MQLSVIAYFKHEAAGQTEAVMVSDTLVVHVLKTPHCINTMFKCLDNKPVSLGYTDCYEWSTAEFFWQLFRESQDELYLRQPWYKILIENNIDLTDAHQSQALSG